MSLACLRDGKVSDKILKKGVLLNRRDNSAFIRKIYEAVVMMIFHSAKLSEVLDYVIEELNKLCSGFYPFQDFVITKAVGDYGDLVPTEGKDSKTGKPCWKVGDYKVKPLEGDEKKRREQMMKKDASTAKEYYLACLPAQVQLAARMGKRGNPVAPGTRLEYVITTNGGHTANQNVKVEDAEYFQKHRETLRIDYLYYMKQLSSQLDQVIDIIYAGKNGFEGNFVLGQYKYRMKVRNAVLKELQGLFRPRINVVGDS